MRIGASFEANSLGVKSEQSHMERVIRLLALLLFGSAVVDAGCSFGICGIDLGTTSSAIAVVGTAEKPYVLRDDSGRSSVPSLLSFEPDGEGVLIGHAAGA